MICNAITKPIKRWMNSIFGYPLVQLSPALLELLFTLSTCVTTAMSEEPFDTGKRIKLARVFAAMYGLRFVEECAAVSEAILSGRIYVPNQSMLSIDWGTIYGETVNDVRFYVYCCSRIIEAVCMLVAAIIFKQGILVVPALASLFPIAPGTCCLSFFSGIKDFRDLGVIHELSNAVFDIFVLFYFAEYGPSTIALIAVELVRTAWEIIQTFVMASGDIVVVDDSQIVIPLAQATDVSNLIASTGGKSAQFLAGKGIVLEAPCMATDRILKEQLAAAITGLDGNGYFAGGVWQELPCPHP